MADPIAEEGASRCPSENPSKTETLAVPCRKEKRKAAKKLKRKQIRKEMALQELAVEEARMNDPEEQLRIRLKEQEEAERCERARKEFQERERLWMEAAAARKTEEEAQQKSLEESQTKEVNLILLWVLSLIESSQTLLFCILFFRDFFLKLLCIVAFCRF